MTRYAIRDSIILSAAIGVSALTLAGCASVGPATVPRDRFDYGAAITESWKRQTLLNMVKLRYSDPPTFVDVGQIVGGYTLQTGLSAGASLSRGGLSDVNAGTLGIAGTFTDRPTITYIPLTGSRFIGSLVTPITPSSLFSAIQAGWPADVILWLGADSINGVRNGGVSGDGATPNDNAYLRAIRLLANLQRSGALSLRVADRKEGDSSTLIAMRSPDAPSEAVAEIGEIVELLHLQPGEAEFSLVYGSAAQTPNEIAVQSRSLLQVMNRLSRSVDVPEEHIREGRASAGRSEAQASQTAFAFHIKSARNKPADAFVAVPYRDMWFYIDDRDFPTKRSFALIMLLFTLADSGGDTKLPVLTIPTQ